MSADPNPADPNPADPNPACEAFSPNVFKPDICKNCQKSKALHVPAAVPASGSSTPKNARNADGGSSANSPQENDQRLRQQQVRAEIAAVALKQEQDRVAAEEAAQKQHMDRMVAIVKMRELSLEEELKALNVSLKSIEDNVVLLTSLLAEQEKMHSDFETKVEEQTSRNIDRDKAIREEASKIEALQKQIANDNIDEVETHMKEFEDAAASCGSLDHIWKTTTEIDRLEAVQVSMLNFADITARVLSVTCRRENSVHAVEDQLIKQDQIVKLAAVNAASTIRRMQTAAQQETRHLEDRRRKLKDHEDEQKFHERRGTFVKERVSHPQLEDLVKVQQRGKHTQLCVDAMKAGEESKALMDHVAALRRDMVNEKREFQATKATLRGQAQELETTAEAAATERSDLERESVDLKSIRAELISLLQVVRHQNR